MIYSYKCEACKEITDIDMPMNDEHPKAIACEKCGKHAHRIFGTPIHIPETFKAASDIVNGDHGANYDYIKDRMKHGSRPSGKDKIYY